MPTCTLARKHSIEKYWKSSSRFIFFKTKILVIFILESCNSQMSKSKLLTKLFVQAVGGAAQRCQLSLQCRFGFTHPVRSTDCPSIAVLWIIFAIEQGGRAAAYLP